VVPSRSLPALVAALSVLLAACAGGGGQLAQQTATSTPGTTIAAPGVEPIAVDELRAPRSARAAARELAEVEAGLRTDGAVAAALGRRQQLAYRAISAHPQWETTVLAQVPDAVRDAVRANLEAGTALSALTGTAPPTFPQWEIRVPQPVSTLRGFYDEAEVATGVPWAYLAAIHLVETRMGRIHGLSSAGAQGPMQFIPETWASYGEGDIDDDRDAIQAAGRYLASRGAPADMDRALFSYNNDDRYVAAVKAYASVLLADPRAYVGYHQWQVFYATTDGTYLLPEGYTA